MYMFYEDRVITKWVSFNLNNQSKKRKQKKGKMIRNTKKTWKRYAKDGDIFANTKEVGD